MSPSITSVKLRLPYPLFCAEFLDDDHLLVGGGGGESRSGVGNGLTVIDLSKDIDTKSSIDLSKSEDAVMSMAIVPNTTPSKLLAGINQNEKLTLDTKANEHFRIFTVSPDKLEVVGTQQHFTPVAWDEIYQRTTVVSPSGKFAAIVASKPKVVKEGVSAGEVVVLQLDEGLPSKKIAVMQMELEVVDADIISADNEEYVVHATPLSYFHREFTHGEDTHKITRFDVHRFVKGGTAIRAIRYLTPSLILLLLNVAGRAGCEIIVISFQPRQPTMVVTRRHLHKGMKAATAVDIVRLKPTKVGQQAVVAVAGADLSIELLILDIDGPDRVSARTFQVLKDTHDFPATRVAFSKTNSQILQLASVSAANTLLVHKIPLVDASYLKRKGNATATVLISVFSLVFIALLAVALQLVFEYRGDLPKAGERIAHVWEEVVDSVVGQAKLGQGSKYERVKERVGGLVNDMKGVEAGVGDGLKKEMAQGIVEGLMGAMG